MGYQGYHQEFVNLSLVSGCLKMYLRGFNYRGRRKVVEMLLQHPSTIRSITDKWNLLDTMIKLLLKSLHFTSNSLELIPESFYRFGMSAQTIANLRQDTRIVQLLGTWADKMFKSACLIFNLNFVLVSIARTHSQVEPQPLRLQNLLRPLPGEWITPWP